MNAKVIRADYAALLQMAGTFGQQAELVRQTLQQLNRDLDGLQAGDWLGRGAQAFYAEMNGQVLPSMNRMARALAAAGDVTRQINQIVQQAEQEAATYLRVDGNRSGAGAAIGGAAVGTASGSSGDGEGGLPDGVSAFRKPGDGGGGTRTTGQGRRVTTSPRNKREAQATIDDLMQDNPKLAAAIKKDPALRRLLEQVEHAGYFVSTSRGMEGLSVSKSELYIGPDTTVAEFKDLAKDALSNPRILKELDPKTAAVIKKNPVLLERVLNWAENRPEARLTMGKPGGGNVVEGSEKISIDPKRPAESLDWALRKVERGDESDIPMAQKWLGQRNEYVKQSAQRRLNNDADEVFHALRAQLGSTGKMSSQLPTMKGVRNPELYHTIVKGYFDGHVDEAEAIEAIAEMMEGEPANVTRRAQYEAMAHKAWSDYAAAAKASTPPPTQRKP